MTPSIVIRLDNVLFTRMTFTIGSLGFLFIITRPGSHFFTSAINRALKTEAVRTTTKKYYE